MEGIADERDVENGGGRYIEEKIRMKRLSHSAKKMDAASAARQ